MCNRQPSGHTSHPGDTHIPSPLQTRYLLCSFDRFESQLIYQGVPWSVQIERVRKRKPRIHVMALNERRGGKGLEVSGGRGFGKWKQPLFRLIRRASRERKSREKMGARDPGAGKHSSCPRISHGHYFPCGLFNVMLEGLSERDTTRSLEVMLTGLNGQLWKD